ncbi:MAG TPA: hypothetical protein VG734_12290 [Lacunisphaera sp.]|nr:hypothetical protein [Lacunisphaera sp.]
MTVDACRPGTAPFFRPPNFALRAFGWFRTGVAWLTLAGGLAGAETPVPGEFGKDIQLAPLVVNGKPLTVAIHARTRGDRRYGEKFADEVVEIAYETLGDTTFKGLVIVGQKGEPHPVAFFRKFMAMAKAGQLDPSLGDAAAEVEAGLKKLEDKFKIDDNDAKAMGITFDTFLPAMPLPLPGVTSRLYQLAWAERFEEARVEQKLKTLTRLELERDELKRFDWVFYLPPQSASGPVLNEVVEKGMKKEKLGLVTRGLIRTAIFTFKPVINKAIEGLRKGMLFHTILEAKSGWSQEDIRLVSEAYVQQLMPDLKPGNGDERKRALAAIEKQKAMNAEYAKDPFVKPARLANFDPAAYAIFEGDYTDHLPEVTHRFKREGDSFQWNYRDQKPRTFYAAGDRLFVNEDGTMTIRFLVDDKEVVTGVEERWVRRRKTVAVWTEEAAAQSRKDEGAKKRDGKRKVVEIKLTPQPE